MTNWSGRMPPSFTTTNYNEGTWDDNTPWSGIIINDQVWNSSRRQIGQLSYHYLVDSGGFYLTDSAGDRLTGLATFVGDNWTGRTLPL